MIGKIAGAVLGRKLAGRYNGGTGLLVGALAPAIARRAFGPVGLAVGGAWVAKKLWDRRNRVARPAPPHLLSGLHLQQPDRRDQ